MFDFVDAQGRKTGISAPMFPPPPNFTHDAPPPQTPFDNRGDFRGGDDRQQDFGVYSGDEY